jgi:Domain of unknown function (DUF3331)
MCPDLSAPIGCAPSQALMNREGARDAISRMVETLLGQRTPTNRITPRSTRRLGKFRPCDRSAVTCTTEPVEKQAPAPTRLEIVERLSRETLSIYWSDARTGLYADQRWRLGRARVRSICALTRVPIHVGDPIYRPKSHGASSPANLDSMILAEMVHDEFTEHEAS